MGAVCHNTRSTQANETDEDTNNAEGDLFSEEEDEEENKEEDEEDEDDGSGDEDSTYLAMLAEVAEAKKKAEALKAKKAKKLAQSIAEAEAEAEAEAVAQATRTKVTSSVPLKPTASPASSKKRGRTTNSYKLAKEYITQLENTEDYNTTKSFIAAALWKEKFADVEASLGDIDYVHEVK
jgi:regulator of protease activity HflC (stomatin/prohibitin superfamily)